MQTIVSIAYTNAQINGGSHFSNVLHDLLLLLTGIRAESVQAVTAGIE